MCDFMKSYYHPSKYPDPDKCQKLGAFFISPDETGIVKIMKDRTVYYMNCRMGKVSEDMKEFTLERKSWQRVRRHNAYGCSRIFLERMMQLGCEIFNVAVDGIKKYRLSMRDMFRKGIFDSLTSNQSVHVFVPIDEFEVIQ